MNDPLTGCVIGQGFAKNANSLYKTTGLLGHPAIDENCGYGTPIFSFVEGDMYSAYFPSKPASDGYTAIYLLCQTPLETFEFSVGHVSEIFIKIGDHVKKGDLIGREGNKGQVYYGDQHITLAMQAAGDKRGSHRHYQKRPVVKKRFAHSPFLQTANGPYYDAEGNYFEIPMYYNGFNGCVDWTLPLFNKDMEFGDENYSVLLLQRALVLEGFGAFEPTGFYGQKTVAAVQKYQSTHGIATIGRCGPTTRKSLNEKYHQF